MNARRRAARSTKGSKTAGGKTAGSKGRGGSKPGAGLHETPPAVHHAAVPHELPEIKASLPPAAGISHGAPASEKAAEPKPALKPETKPRQVKPEKAEKRKRLHRHSLQEYLEKAGYEMSDVRMRRIIRWSLIGLLLAASLVVGVIGIAGGSWQSVLLSLVLLWTVGLAAVWLVVWAALYFFLDYRIYQRTKELEEVLPDFLQLASSNIAAGMPIDRALWYAIRPNFGVLAKEMEDVAKATMAGEDLEVSLQRMTNRYDSVVLRRSINILVEGLHAGGEMADLLNKISLNIEEMRIMKKEMAASVTTYAIFITFAAVAIAPVLFALATELLSIIIKITGSLDLGASSSMITLAAPNADAIANFRLFSILMLIVLNIFSAAIVSVIKRGSVFEGVKTMPVYAIISLVIYFVALRVLHAAFGTII